MGLQKAILKSKGYVVVETICPKGHRGKQKLDMGKQTKWMPDVIKALNKCLKCEEHLALVRKRISGGKAVLIFNCSKHKRMRKALTDSVFYAIDAAQTQMTRQARNLPPAPYYSPSSTSSSGSRIKFVTPGFGHFTYIEIEELAKKMRLNKKDLLAKLNNLPPEEGFYTSNKKHFIGKIGIRQLGSLIQSKSRISIKEVHKITDLPNKAIEEVLTYLMSRGKIKGVINTRNNEFISTEEFDSLIFNYLEA